MNIHDKTASKLFGTPKEEVSEAQRDAGKCVNFGALYGKSRINPCQKSSRSKNSSPAIGRQK